jgi:hypothetical protein
MQKLIKEINRFASDVYDKNVTRSPPVHSEVIGSCNICYRSKNGEVFKIILYIPEVNELEETMKIDYDDLINDYSVPSDFNIKEVFGPTEPYKFAFTIFKIGSDMSKNQISELLKKNTGVKSYYVTEYVEIHIKLNYNKLRKFKS